MSAPSGGIPPEKLELYDNLVATQAGVERKGKTMPYTSVNGNMFSFLKPTGTLALRLPVDDRQPLSRSSAPLWSSNTVR